MPLDDPRTVDAVGIDTLTGHAVLTIADAMSWEDVNRHLARLEEKVNAYLDFIESGQLFDSSAVTKGCQPRINVVFRFAPPAAATAFLAKASDVAAGVGVLISHETWCGRGGGE